MFSDIIAIVSIILASLSLLISYYIYKASRTDASYLDIDNQYSSLLEIGLDDPDLRDYEKTSMFYKLDPQDPYRKKYHIYANMCWNLVETIYDRQKDKKGRFKLSSTWLPVLFEENRLHYTWFKHNVRLFKQEFEEFVSSELNDIEIIEGRINELKEIYPMFKRDFAADERKDYDHLEKLMQRGKYKMLLAKHKAFDEIIGYAFVYEVEDHKAKALWLDYMAIDMKFQNAGYGTLLLNKIAEMKQDGNLGIFIEIETPNSKDEATRLEQERRIKFYERLGAKRLEFNYQLPTNNGGFPMYLYFKPLPSVRMLTREHILSSISSTFNYIHFDVGQKDDILNSFKNNITNEYFG